MIMGCPAMVEGGDVRECGTGWRFPIVGFVAFLLSAGLAGAEVREVVLLDGPPYYGNGSVVRVAVGDTVKWKNPMMKDGATHTVTQQGCFTGDACEFDSGVLTPGQVFSYTFTTAGTYPYRCRLHAPMEGVVVVER